ncbi:methyltransferase-like protein 24 isoform X2 [Amphibalanus amphitrite]|uniref:methyltransferase-like protein 24 isoform X2 n=1 Tax=Amphibalanus amphitrite TaxID=1232801 RepID=UPI001C92A39E|nr:methyltransferase-like protein 24 isoform X2 [Amphibalanus amphitrite]XP_043236240.1 methyltransferase-like protein 24 isoform X2 [Amphibalanus amphitrite]
MTGAAPLASHALHGGRDLALNRNGSRQSKERSGRFRGQPLTVDGSSVPDSQFSAAQKRSIRTAYKWVGTNTTWCRRQASFGGQAYSNRNWESRIQDGDRPVCLDSEFSISDERSPCVVYAYGVSYDWTFDDGMARFGCEVHSFDPSIGAQPARRPSGVHFHPVGLGRNDHVNAYGWQIWTLDRAMRELGHDHLPRLQYLKLDSEGSEWDMFSQQLFDGVGHQALDKFDQIGVEVHMRKAAEREMEFYERIANVTVRLSELGWEVAQATPTKIYPVWFRFPGLDEPVPLMYDLLLVNRRRANRNNH